MATPLNGIVATKITSQGDRLHHLKVFISTAFVERALSGSHSGKCPLTHAYKRPESASKSKEFFL